MYDIGAFYPKKHFLKQGQLQINLFCFIFVLLFKAKQRFAYLLLIQSVNLFLNILFLFGSVFHFFKCFRFVSLSKQFDIEALLSKNLYYR